MSQLTLLRAAAEVLSCLDEAGLRACVIGGLAVVRWGEPRTTRDVDLTVFAPFGEEAPVLDLLLARFRARRQDARAFAITSRVVLLYTTAGPEADVSIAGFPFEQEALELASAWEAEPGFLLRTCPAEHLIVYKLVAARPIDLVDVEGIVRRQGRKLDVQRIRYWGRQFAELKEDPDLLRPFESVFERI